MYVVYSNTLRFHPRREYFRQSRFGSMACRDIADLKIDIVSLLSNIQKESADESSTQTLDSFTPKIRQEKKAAPASDAEKLEGGLDVQSLEEEAGQEAAFNPETGEINWDCPCLGGMAHGPCGEEFKAAFSCFVYSEEEPKGIDCIEKFKYVYPVVCLCFVPC